MSIKLKAGLNHVYAKIGIGLLADFINYQNLSISEKMKTMALDNVRK